MHRCVLLWRLGSLGVLHAELHQSPGGQALARGSMLQMHGVGTPGLCVFTTSSAGCCCSVRCWSRASVALTHLSQDLSEVFKRGCARVVVDEASWRPHLAPVLLISMWHFSSCFNCQSCLNWYFQTVFFKQFLHLTIKQKFLTRILGTFSYENHDFYKQAFSCSFYIICLTRVSVSVALLTLLKVFFNFYSCFFSFLCWSFHSVSFSKLK